MRFVLRLVVPVVICIAVISGLFAYFQVQNQKGALRQELQDHAHAVAQDLADNLQPLLEKNSLPTNELSHALSRFSEREHLAGAVLLDDMGKALATSQHLSAEAESSFAQLAALGQTSDPDGRGEFVTLAGRYKHAEVVPLYRENGEGAGKIVVLAVFHDADYIPKQAATLWKDALLHASLEVFLIAFITLIIIRWTVFDPIARTAQWLKALRQGNTSTPPALPPGELFRPLAKEMAGVVKSLESARAAAQREARLRAAGEAVWTPERLSIHVRRKLGNRRLVVVSNREPYIHTRQKGHLDVVVPASGLVTAIEPILRACDGTWIAQGSGDADHETVDEHDRLRVPPGEQQYTLRRVWLTSEEEKGYYFGFANEGLWPLCHIAHTRPTFRVENWEHYQQVNQKFADAVLEEIAGTEQPCVLVQDYHFALLPKLIKQQRPDARVAIFWHIPWPNAEAFGICPWERELLDGLLGADLTGFHIQNHCNNFLETVDHALESRIDWEGFAVNRGGHFTRVRPFPISIDFSEANDERAERESPYVDRAELLRAYGVEAAFMGVGVDRVDYTKGILERFHGIERFLEKYPMYQGRFTFVQIGSPSRTEIKRYHDLFADIALEAERINKRFFSSSWKPIVLLRRHHTHQEIQRFYRAANFCLVTSLHDGMNLVAKEYIAARDDGRGTLILSRFAGACRELHDALIVNPYDIEQIAEAIRTALEMEPEEAQQRMDSMRRTVREHNIYRWAANLIEALSDVRLETPGVVVVPEAAVPSPPPSEVAVA